jgi:DNA-binding GntR family transcriptional regulator
MSPGSRGASSTVAVLEPSEPASSAVAALQRGGSRLNYAVYDQLKERLLEGRYAAGDRLSAEALRTEFGVSKQPVMEAVRRLARDGLIEIVPQALDRARGYRLLNRRFHHAIHEMSHSRIMADTSRRMWDLSDFLINTSDVPQPFSAALDDRHADHERILAARQPSTNRVVTAQALPCRRSRHRGSTGGAVLAS